MAVREIKTSITLDGEQQFRQAIAAANKELRVSEAELKAVASAYDLNGDKMQMLANKQRILGKEITVQENTVSSLRARMKEAERVYEEAGKSVDKFRAELEKANASGNKSNIDQATNDVERAEKAYAAARKQLQNYRIDTSNAETKLNQLRKTQQATDREIEEFGRDSIKVGRQIEDGIGDSAEAAEKDVRSLVKTLQDDLSSIRANTTFTAIGSLWDMATDAYSSVSTFVEGTQEYRKQLSYLEFNAEQSGFGFDVVKDKLIETQAMTADASSAMEGLNNLLQIEGLSEEQLTRAMEGLLGASIKWQDTLKFESLADSLQETLATGEAVGAYAELLGRLGYDLDVFNAMLEEGELPTQDIETAIAALEGKGLEEVYQEYKENNADLIKELETIARLEMASARIGEIISRNITTPIKSKFTDVLEWIADEMTKFEEDPAAYAEELPTRVISATTDAAGEAFKAVGKHIYPTFAPYYSDLVQRYQEEGNEEAAKAVDQVVSLYYGAKAAEFLVSPQARSEWLMELARKGLGEIFTADGNARTFDSDTEAKIAMALDNYTELKTEQNRAAIDAAMEYAQNWDGFFGSGTETMSRKSWEEMMQQWAPPEKAEEAGEAAAEAYLDGWETMVMRPDLAQEAEGFLTDEAGNAIKPIGIRENWEEYLKTITDMVPKYEEAGADAGEATVEGFGDELKAAEDQARTMGEAAALAFGSGIASKVSYVAAQASALAAAATARMQTARSGVVQAVFNVDGRQMATALAPYNNEIMAVEDYGDLPFTVR